MDGVGSILDVGGGTGAFSFPLARRGFDVTHVDFSPAMLTLAREKALDKGNIRFVEANAADLSEFDDLSFDLILAMDGAISFAGTQAERALKECCRVTRSTLITTVSPLSSFVPRWVAASRRCMESSSRPLTP